MLNKKLIILIISVLFLAFLVSKNLGIYLIKSGSMAPHIPRDSLVITLRTDKYINQDIITYKSDYHSFITHRVHGKTVLNNQTIYTTKGDNNSYIDKDLVYANNIAGKVVLVVPFVGYLLKPALIIPMVYAPLGLLLGISIKTCIIR